MVLMSRVKVNREMRKTIMELRRMGMTQADIAGTLRLSQGTVSVVLREVGMGGKLMRLRA